MSKEVVAYRVNNLKKNGVIESFYAVVDVARLGFCIVDKVEEKVLLRFVHK